MTAYKKTILVVLMGLLVGLLMFWGFTKTGFYSKLKRGDALIVQEAIPIVYITDPDVGPMLLPNTKIHYHTPYFDTTVITNADGFTGRNYPLQTDNYRIAILGDSAVEAYGVDDTNRFTHMTEALVYRKTGGKQKVEVMGFGVSGWGTVHQYGAIKKFVLKYKPNEIWLMFLPTNDFGDNTPLLNGPPLGPTFIYKNEISDEIVDIRFGYPDIPEALEVERKRRYGEKELQQAWNRWTNGLLPYYWSTEHNPQWDLVESHTLQTLGLIKALCDAKNIKLNLIYRSTLYEKNQKDFETYRKDVATFLKRDLPMDQKLGVTRLQIKLNKMGIGFINLLEMKEAGIRSKADEANVQKHLRMAEFFSDKIIEGRGFALDPVSQAGL